MGGIRNNVGGEVYPEVEVDDDLGVGLSPGLADPVPTAVTPMMVVVGVDNTSTGFLMGAVYMKMKCWRSR